MTDENRESRSGSKVHRGVTAAFGVFFAVIAIVLFVVSDRSLGPALAAAVLLYLGVDAVVAAYRDRRSLLSRIGPLP